MAHYPHMRQAANLLFVSGISCRKPDGTLEGTDIRGQTRAVIENLRAILRSADADLANLVDVTVFLADISDYSGYNAVYDTYFEAETGPTRTTVAVKDLPLPGLLIEIKAVALAPSPKPTDSYKGDAPNWGDRPA